MSSLLKSLKIMINKKKFPKTAININKQETEKW